MNRILAISDIHGHAEGAQALLRMADYAPGEDRLYLLGDYIDTAPETWTSLREMRQLTEGGARAVLGYMERWLLVEASKPDGGMAAVGGMREQELEWLRATPLSWQDGGYCSSMRAYVPACRWSSKRPKI